MKYFFASILILRTFQMVCLHTFYALAKVRLETFPRLLIFSSPSKVLIITFQPTPCSLPNLKSVHSKKTSHQQQLVHTTTLSYKMCFDTGTSPKSLCSHQDFFRNLVLFDHPKHVSLADSDSILLRGIDHSSMKIGK